MSLYLLQNLPPLIAVCYVVFPVGMYELINKQRKSSQAIRIRFNKVWKLWDAQHSRDTSSFHFFLQVSLQWVAQTARQHCEALIHSYTPTINRAQLWKLRPEHPLWKGCAASCSGNVWDHCSPSPLISSYAESRWSDAFPFCGFLLLLDLKVPTTSQPFSFLRVS